MEAADHLPAAPPLQGRTRLVVTLALAGAVFMNVLDLTIANVSLPAIAGDLGASPTQGTWIITSFAVANAIMVPLTGWLARRIGQVRLFILATLGFVITSIMCGCSVSIEMLVAFRVLQGICAGPMIPLSQTLLLESYPPDQASRAMVAWALPSLAGPVLGPLLGGYITDSFSWPWIFFINVPIGLIAASLTWSLLKDRESQRRRTPVDVAGLLLLVSWVGALQLMLDKGRELDWFNSGEITLLGAVALVGFCLFVVWELHDEHPVVDLKLFRRASFSIGVTLTGLGFGVYFSGVVLISLWMQQTLGYSSMLAGTLNAPPGLVAFFLAPLAARLMSRVGAPLLACCGFFAMMISNVMRAGFVPDAMPAMIVIPQLVVGLGISFIFLPSSIMTIGGLPPDRIAAASGLANFVRLIATAVLTSGATTLWDYQTSVHRADLAAHVSLHERVSVQYLDRLADAGIAPAQALDLVDRQVNSQAATMGVTDYFWLCGLLFAILTLVTWASRYFLRIPHTGAAK